MPPTNTRKKAGGTKAKATGSKPPKRQASRFEKPRVSLKKTQEKPKKAREENRDSKPNAQKTNLCRGVKHDGTICTNKVAPGKRSYCKIHAPDSVKTDAKPRTTKTAGALTK
jgi:hypothetical protein